MIKILTAVCALLVMTACATTGRNAGKQTQETTKTHMLAGGYSDQRPLSTEDKELFRRVTAELDGVSYTPESVATQVVAGRNYRFICTAKTVTLEPQTYKAEVVVFQPLPGKGEARITSIKRL